MRAIAPLGVAILNIHASGGLAMMRAAAEEARKAGAKRPKIIGVTMLTSLDDHDLARPASTGTPSEQVLRLAQARARTSGLDGVVCSAHEIEPLRGACGPRLHARRSGHPTGRRVARRPEARDDAARSAARSAPTILVIGRPITAAADPAAAARAIRDELFPRAA